MMLLAPRSGIRTAVMRSVSSRSRFKRRRFTSTTQLWNPPYRILLLGSDQFSCATLRALMRAKEDLIQEIVVVTPPDGMTGKGMKGLHRPALRTLAEELNLPVLVLPRTTMLEGWLPPSQFLDRSTSNLLLTASFGHLIPSSLLDRFESLNTLNVHPSLLPKYRGAAPIQWTIINGDFETGVTVQELSKNKFDCGRILGQETISIAGTGVDPITFSSLEPILSKGGADLLVSVLRNLSHAQANAMTQDSSKATAAHKIRKEMSFIKFATQNAHEILRLHRAISHQFPLRVRMQDATKASTSHELQLIDLSTGSLPPSDIPADAPVGSAFRRQSDIFVRCIVGGNGCHVGTEELLVVRRVKQQGRREISAIDWWNGQKSRSLDEVIKFE